MKKQRHYFANKGLSSQTLVFPEVMHGCQSWTTEKTVCQRIKAFELWYWRRFLWVPWTARRSNQSILKENNLKIHWKDWCWSWNSNTLATWSNELTHWKRPWCWEDWRREKRTIEDEMAGWYHRLTGNEFEQVLSFGYGQESLACCSPWGHKNWDMTERLNWTVAWKRLGSIASKYILLLIYKYSSLDEYFLEIIICSKLKLSLERRPYK